MEDIRKLNTALSEAENSRHELHKVYAKTVIEKERKEQECTVVQAVKKYLQAELAKVKEENDILVREKEKLEGEINPETADVSV